MADENTPGEGQEPNTPAAGQAPTPNGQAPDGTQTPNQPGSDLSPDAAQKLIAELRSENAKRRVELKELDDLRKFRDEVEASKLTEQQKAAAEVDALKKQHAASIEALRTAKLETAIAVQAGALKLADADTALRLVDRSTITFADDGTPDPATVTAALEALVTAKPFLRATPTPPSAGSPANPAKPEGAMTIEQVRALTPEQIAALPPDQYARALAALGGSHT